MTARRTDHDGLYHRLFSDPVVVAQLLTDFVGGDWLADVDLNGMQRLNTKFHARTGKRRDGDMVWRIPRGDGGDTYLVLMLEFQSTNDHFMALRVLTYASLLWQHLQDEKRLVPDGKLPPLVPVVVYNGDGDWGAPVTLRDLVALPPGSTLWRWQPDFSYHLIQVSAFRRTDLDARDSLPALWFRLENAADPGEVLAVAEALGAWLARHPGFAAAKAAFVELLSATMARQGPEIRLPAQLQEVSVGLLTRARQWEQEWLKEGREEGLQKGLQKGRQEGEATLLLRQLARRFGPVPPWVTDRVHAADTAMLEEWSLRILDAETLEAIFADPEP